MDEGVGSSTIDASGNGNTGTWSGTPVGNNSTYYSAGKVGNWAGAFDGSTDVVTSLQNTTFGANGSLTFWMNSSNAQLSTSTWSSIVEIGGNGIIWQPSLHAPYVQFCFPGCAAVVGYTPTANTWYFIAATWTQVSGSSSTIVFYENRLIGSALSGSPSANAKLYISESSYAGLIDDVRVYNRALSAAEIQALYNAEK
jgi:hypothetical protein